MSSFVLRLKPFEGELLSSCLVRNARSHGTSPQRLTALFWHGEAVWMRDFDRDPASLSRLEAGSCDWIQTLSDRLGLPEDAVRRTTL